MTTYRSPQIPLSLGSDSVSTKAEQNRIKPEDCAVHDWYRFVLSYPPHLVRNYLDSFDISAGQTVLDPFCGTGTTLVECKKQGIASIGIEALPMASFASSVKVDWTPDSEAFKKHAMGIVSEANFRLKSLALCDVTEEVNNGHSSLRSLSDDQSALLLRDSISPLPAHKVLVLLDCIEESRDDRFHRHERLALAKTILAASNLRFGPEVGTGPLKSDAPVTDIWQAEIRAISADLQELQEQGCTPAVVYRADSREVASLLAPESVDAVITSPPYPNEKDYTRTTRLESVFLGFIEHRASLRREKQKLVRSNTRSVYKNDDDDSWISNIPEIHRIADAIEQRRLDLGKTSGFERLYARVTKLYFGGMARHLHDLQKVLRPGARLAYVVGDQASYLQIMIRTGQLLAEIGQSLGYELVSIDLFRSRRATATRQDLREEVVVFRWPGKQNSEK